MTVIALNLTKRVEEKQAARFQTKPCTSIDLPWSEATVSAKQPENVGHPYQVHAPLEAFRALSKSELSALVAANVLLEERQPLFLRTNQKFVRASIKLGDLQTARLLVATLSRHTRRVYKNWL